MIDPALGEVARLLGTAEAIVVVAGAGLAATCGIPDIADDTEFWRHYPELRDIELGYRAMAQPRWFGRDAALAWGIFGPRIDAVRAAEPSTTYATLHRWVAAKEHFVFTTNTDRHFERAGFGAERLYEVLGRDERLQCSLPCGEHRWGAPASPVVSTADQPLGRAAEPWPTCPSCGRSARPNAILFDDWTFVDIDVVEQRKRYRSWLADRHMTQRMLVLELGATDRLSVARAQSEHLVEAGARLVRVDPDRPDGPHGTLSVASPVDAAVAAIDALLVS